MMRGVIYSLAWIAPCIRICASASGLPKMCIRDSRSMSGLGPAQASILIVVSQIVVAYCIELFGLFGVDKADFEWRKLIGAAVAVAGIIIFRK